MISLNRFRYIIFQIKTCGHYSIWILQFDSLRDNSVFLCNSVFNFAVSSFAKRSSYSQIANFSSSASFSSSKLWGSATAYKISIKQGISQIWGNDPICARKKLIFRGKKQNTFLKLQPISKPFSILFHIFFTVISNLHKATSTTVTGIRGLSTSSNLSRSQ